MSGTSKAIVSMCVLLLAALVVYYGMTPPPTTDFQSVDIPQQHRQQDRPSMFSRDPYEALEQIGFPAPAANITTKDTNVVVDQEPPRRVDSTVIVVDVPSQEVKVTVNQTYTLYSVKEGETLGEIASQELGSYRMWREIAALNNIDDPSRIMPGRVLRMPHKVSTTIPTTPVAIAGTTTHRVVEGDTMSSIAGEYYDDVNKFVVIANANPTVDPKRLKIGSRLVIPTR